MFCHLHQIQINARFFQRNELHYYISLKKIPTHTARFFPLFHTHSQFLFTVLIYNMHIKSNPRSFQADENQNLERAFLSSSQIKKGWISYACSLASLVTLREWIHYIFTREREMNFIKWMSNRRVFQHVEVKRRMKMDAGAQKIVSRATTFCAWAG